MAGLALLVWISSSGPAPEPEYQDRPLSYWVVQLADSDSQAERDQAALAVRSIGTNAIPVLLQMLGTPESPFRTKFLAWRRGWYRPFGFHIWQPPNNLGRAQAGFRQLGSSAAPAVPDLLKIRDENRSREFLDHTAAILGNIGPDAKAAVPSLLRAAVSTNRAEHSLDFEALGKIHAEPGLAVPVLVQVISNSPADRYYAVAAAGQFGSDAKAAVPILVALLGDPSISSVSPRGTGYVSDRENIERALQKIDPATYARLVTNGQAASAP
ncbi:MAG: hypothetical protein ABSH48_12060 [Verrucomicrobiota bacterium]